MTGPNLKCLEPYFSDFIKLSTYYWSHSPIKKIKIRNRKVIVWRWPSHHIDVIKDLLTVAINYPDFIFSCLCQNITRYYCNTCDITKLLDGTKHATQTNDSTVIVHLIYANDILCAVSFFVLHCFDKQISGLIDHFHSEIALFQFICQFLLLLLKLAFH